ncbi:DUF6476 family protein [Roseobacter sp. S98]|uniref:DUF6476 family protein n=1 Tax=Roseobacter algicola (ex Choi et al. 2025) (nom. illeg.) TaxID=3092138 RepID=UPI0035C6A71A
MDNPELKPDDEVAEPANLRFLRRLVTVLTATMIGGVLLIIALIVIRFYDRPPPLPETITLPDGAAAQAFTQGDGWFAVVTTDNRILIYDRVTGDLRQSITISE